MTTALERFANMNAPCPCKAKGPVPTKEEWMAALYDAITEVTWLRICSAEFEGHRCGLAAGHIGSHECADCSPDGYQWLI